MMKPRKSLKIWTPLMLAAAASGCAGDITQIVTLETDTFISSDPAYTTGGETDGTIRAELPYLEIAKSPQREVRTLVKLPTGTRNEDENLEETLGDLFLAVFFMPLFILQEVLDCYNDTLQPGNLQEATLVFDIDAYGGGSLSNQVRLSLLSSPWWHKADWSVAHPFSGKGTWATPGGDIAPDSDFLPEQATENAGVIEFDITEYFRTLISNQRMPHYGFVLDSVNGTLNTARLKSTQAPDWSQRPRVVANYSGACKWANGRWVEDGQTRSVYILGKNPTVLRESVRAAVY